MTTEKKVCAHCGKNADEGKYCVKDGVISCLHCILRSADIQEQIDLNEQDVIADHEKRSYTMSRDPLANEVKSAARRLSTLMLGAANALMVENYMTNPTAEARKLNASSRLAMLNELDRIVEIVHRLDLLADKIVARGD